jgi:hypothetical protein
MTWRVEMLTTDDFCALTRGAKDCGTDCAGTLDDRENRTNVDRTANQDLMNDLRSEV